MHTFLYIWPIIYQEAWSIATEYIVAAPAILKFLQPILILSETHSFRKTAASSDCVGALPRSSLQEAFGRRKLVELPFRAPAPSTTGGIAYLKNRMLPPAAEVLIKEIVDYFQRFNKVD